MRHYLVTIDTTNRPNAKGFRPGIQNFYICLAPDENSAKNIVLSTFRSNPNFINQLLPCTSATPLEAITRLLTPNQALWSYIPFNGIRAPGQQKLIPTPDSIVNNNPIVNMSESRDDFKPSSVQVQPPKTYDAQTELDMQESRKLLPPEKSKTQVGDTLDQLLNDPRFKDALLEKLGIGNSKKTVDDSSEVALRHSDEGSYDDDITGLPTSVQRPQVSKTDNSLPSQPPQGPIPGLMEPDADTMRRIRSNIKQVNLETID